MRLMSKLNRERVLNYESINVLIRIFQNKRKNKRNCKFGGGLKISKWPHDFCPFHQLFNLIRLTRNHLQFLHKEYHTKKKTIKKNVIIGVQFCNLTHSLLRLFFNWIACKKTNIFMSIFSKSKLTTISSKMIPYVKYFSFFTSPIFN